MIRPLRDLRRSISISKDNPPISKRVEIKLREIREHLEGLARDAIAEVLKPYETWEGGLRDFSIKHVEAEIEQTTSDSLESRFDVSPTVEKLKFRKHSKPAHDPWKITSDTGILISDVCRISTR